MAITANINVPQGIILAAYSFPTPDVRAAQAGIVAAFRQTAQIEAPQAMMLVAARGRIANPRLRSWTFPLDGHDFYVLRLGDFTTLLYDTTSEQWIEWTSGGLNFWRPNTGINWIGAGALAHTYGSDIVVGDDTFGLLWFLDPLLPYDEHPDPDRDPQQVPFDRIVTGQVLASGRQFLPCYALFLDGDNYGLTAGDFTPTILLETSDDQGRNFDAYDALTVEPDISVNNPYAWYSLGQFGSPGRIFRVTDTGVLTRIDAMSMNDAG